MAETASLQESGITPEKGKWYRLLTDFGEGVGMLTRTRRYRPAGAEGDVEGDRMLYVLDVAAPATHGIGYANEDSVVALWLSQSGPGRLSAHHISLPLSQFCDLTGEGEEPPEWADWQAQQSAGER
ncbi:hypothetical protein [Streptomyces sp. NPDC017260]|uniref:hypothetical protein n=1 Tax=unclassified Streptomyces TaxID=2593676 RepID=UPI0037B00E87